MTPLLPEHPAQMRANAVALAYLPDLMQEYREVLDCLDWIEPHPSFTYGTRVAYIPAVECLDPPAFTCCTMWWQRWCDWACDGWAGTKTDGTRYRISGAIEDWDIPWGGVVIVLPDSCTDPDGSVRKDAGKHELLHALRWYTGDPNWGAEDSWPGWACQ